MKKEHIRKDLEGNDVYLKLEVEPLDSTIVNCYAYRKLIKKIWFLTYEKFVPICHFNSSLSDPRCSSFIVTSRITESNRDEMLNEMLDKVMNQVNRSISDEKRHIEALNFIFGK